MPSKEYLEAARTLQDVALKMTDRMLAGQLRALAEDCERRAEKAAQANAVEASALQRRNSSFPKSRSCARLKAARAVWLAERTLEKIEDPAVPPQEREVRAVRLEAVHCPVRRHPPAENDGVPAKVGTDVIEDLTGLDQLHQERGLLTLPHPILPNVIGDQFVIVQRELE